jgi:hypothetical protein
MRQVRRHDEWSELDLYEQLEEEFGDRVDPQFLHNVAREEASSFSDARIRDFIPLIAYRQARQRVARHLHRGVA